MAATKRILIIDDDRKLNDLLKSYLSKFGMDVTPADRPQEGLTLFKRLKPDLVILDVMLPDMDGFQVLKEIRNDGREPDAWESIHLMHALGALHGERLTYALTLIELAIEDPADRAPEAVARIQKELASAEILDRAFRNVLT